MVDVGIPILWPYGQFSGHLAYVMAIWYMFPRFGTFYPFWHVVTRKIWQPCCGHRCFEHFSLIPFGYLIL
jgi:hypothetical protein